MLREFGANNFSFLCSCILHNTTHENNPNRGAEISENGLLLEPVECLGEMDFVPWAIACKAKAPSLQALSRMDPYRRDLPLESLSFGPIEGAFKRNIVQASMIQRLGLLPEAMILIWTLSQSGLNETQLKRRNCVTPVGRNWKGWRYTERGGHKWPGGWGRTKTRQSPNSIFRHIDRPQEQIRGGNKNVWE